MKRGKLIIFSAPSGSGKSTIIKYLIDNGFDFAFSVSATSRAPRGEEKHGVEYYFMSAEEFKQKIDNNEFVEYEEVYQGCYYGTLKSEIESKLEQGKNMLFDIDVVGGVNVKNAYADEALSIFVQPPSVEELRKRLVSRATDTAEMIEKRIAKAEWELEFANKFDVIIVNDNLTLAQKQTQDAIERFISKK